MTAAQRIESVSKLVDALRSISEPYTVAVDGASGAGKTHLASLLANQIGAAHLDLDDFVQRGQGAFVSAIDFQALRDRVAEQPDKLLISGVCMREVLDRLPLSASQHIYVMRMDATGWADRAEIEGNLLEELATVFGDGIATETLAAEVKIGRAHV